MNVSHTAQLILGGAIAVDLVIGEYPDVFHPVVYMGKYIKFLWNKKPVDENRNLLVWGIFLVLSGLILFSGLSAGILSVTGGWPGIVLAFFLLKPAFALKALVNAAKEVREALAGGNLDEARRLTSYHLVSRNTDELSEEEICGAVIESVSENLTDSFISPLFFYAVAGIPGALAYRFANTCDSMLGYREGDYEKGGKFAARFDDLLNWIPARIGGGLLVCAAEFNGCSGAGALAAMKRSRGLTDSPNAGWTMSAMAGALEIKLEKRGQYSLDGGALIPDFHFIDKALKITMTGAGLYLLIILAVLEVVL